MAPAGEDGTRKLNSICRWAALAITAAAALAGPLHNPSLPGMEDFGQYYLAGHLALQGRWDALYPVPDPKVSRNAGWRNGSVMKPHYAAEAARLGVGDVNRYILPPPTAYLFTPLALFPFRAATWIWFSILVLCGWGVAVQAGRIYQIASGRASMIPGLLILLVALSPLMRRAIRTAQLSPLVALCIGSVVLGLMRPSELRTALAIVTGAFTKIAPVIFIPLFMLLRRSATLMWIAVLAALPLGFMAITTGGEIYGEYLGTIVPTLKESSAWRGNQAFSGLYLRLTGSPGLTPPVRLALTGGWLMCFLAASALVLRRRRELSGHSPAAAAGAAAFLLPVMIFGPLAWEHYFVYLCPLWGWLAWEAGRSRLLAVAAPSVIVLTWAPLAIAPWLKLREPLLSHMLAASLLMLAIAFYRLWNGAAPAKAQVLS